MVNEWSRKHLRPLKYWARAHYFNGLKCFRDYSLTIFTQFLYDLYGDPFGNATNYLFSTFGVYHLGVPETIFI